MITVRKLKSITIACISLLAIVSVEKVNAQTFAFRNNLLYDATLTPNLGFDVRLDSKWTAGAVVGLNAWDIDKEKNKKWRHLLVAPNVRRWLGDSLFKGAKERRLQGDLFALGGKYGYSWILGRAWRIEAEAGVAVGYAWYKEYECPHCGTYLGEGNRIFLLPQLGVNVVYIIN